MLPDGARDYWAFKLPDEDAGARLEADYENPVDRFLDAARRDAGVTAGPRADPLTRLRRAYLDLTGLPPTPEQVAGVPGRPRTGRLGTADRAAARLAALRRALGAALDGRGPLRRLDGVRAGLPPRQRVAVPRLHHQRLQPGQALQPVPARADRRRRARPRHRRDPHRHRVPAGGAAGELPREGQPRAAARLSGRRAGDSGARGPRHDRALRAVPRPQVRPHPAEGLLQHAGVDLRVRRDRLSAARSGRGDRVPREERGDRSRSSSRCGTKSARSRPRTASACASS